MSPRLKMVPSVAHSPPSLQVTKSEQPQVRPNQSARPNQSVRLPEINNF